MFDFPVEGVGARAGLSLVKLIQGSSRDVVLSDLRTDAREPAGVLQLTLEGIATVDRAGLGALRSQPSWPEGKLFTMLFSSAVKLFTTGTAAEQGFPQASVRRL